MRNSFNEITKLEDYFEDEKRITAIQKLSKDEKDILLLSILGNYTSKEIGKMYGKNVNQIRGIIKYAIKKTKNNYGRS